MSKEEYTKLIDEAYHRLKTDLVPNHDGWSPVTHPEAVEWSYSKLLPGTSVNIVKARGKVPCAAEKVHLKMWFETEEEKKKDDENQLAHQVLENYGNNDGKDGDMNVIYQLYALPWPLSNRDMVLLRGVRVAEDGTIYNISVSIEHPKDPKPSKVVRASITNTAYVFKPISDSECELTYIVCMDPMGSIPKWLVSQNISKCALRVEQIAQKNHQ